LAEKESEQLSLFSADQSQEKEWDLDLVN